jgi:hypothetical protein
MIEFEPFEPYEFIETDRLPNRGVALVYRCFRCSTPRTVRVSDRKTHNQYHYAEENGLPNPFVSGWDYSKSMT